MKDTFIKWFMRVNAFLLHLTNGWIWQQTRHADDSSPGNHRAESGQPRVIPIAYFFHEGKYLIVESNWGRDNHADWYLNLKKNSRAIIKVKGQRIPVKAQDAQGEEYDHLWKFATDRHPSYLRYQQ